MATSDSRAKRVPAATPERKDPTGTVEKEIFGGLIRLHVLHHAAREAIFGQGIMDELAHHGYKLSPGTLYPILHGLERSGYLSSTVEKFGKRNRRTYVATATGKKALKQSKARVWELFRELFEDEHSPGKRKITRREQHK